MSVNGQNGLRFRVNNDRKELTIFAFQKGMFNLAEVLWNWCIRKLPLPKPFQQLGIDAVFPRNLGQHRINLAARTHSSDTSIVFGDPTLNIGWRKDTETKVASDLLTVSDFGAMTTVMRKHATQKIHDENANTRLKKGKNVKKPNNQTPTNLLNLLSKFYNGGKFPIKNLVKRRLKKN